ncbi:alpha/beta hydrolase [Pusillimonas caeni]|uniref:alpha/beta fold hydrolase n=1 Tax=Pusillimonas caeni TaxID=1348472 RepID=UPI000E5A0A39|nr:alpha/beta hydrolase [Pusillimonas caeni]TFL14830.1 alpha/beta hydrolase [Pusillimonas caeni]
MSAPVESAAVRHLYFSGEAGDIHALEFGHDASRPPVLLLHGVTGAAWIWHDVAQALGRRRRVIALDLRGHGQSARSASRQYATADHARDLARVADQLDVPALDLAGQSWGALIAVHYASGHPGKVGRLAVVDVEPSFEQAEDAVHPRPRLFNDIGEVLDWERNANPSAPESLLALWARQSVQHGAEGGWVRRHDPFFFERWPFRRDDLWNALPGLDMPSLLVHGRRSFVREPVMRDMAARMPDARLEILDSGHLVPLEAPQALAALLEEHFA